MVELEEIGRDIRNAEIVLLKTYKNIKKMMNKLDEIANERDYMRMQKHFFRFRSDTNPKGYFIRNFLKLYQKNDHLSTNSKSEDRLIDEPILGVQIDLTGGGIDREHLPVVKVIKYIFDYEESGLKDETSENIGHAEGKKFRDPFWEDKFEIKKRKNYNIIHPNDEEISREYWHLERVIYKEISLMEIQDHHDIRTKIFDELESIPEDLD